MKADEISIVIADDHPIFRKGLLSVINGLGKYRVVAEAEDGGEAINLIEKYRPDIAIIDLDMPVCTGLEVANSIFLNHWASRVIILTAHTHPETFIQVIHLPQVSILLKENAITELPVCLNEVSNGKVFISDLARRIISNYSKVNRAQNEIVKMLNALTTTEQKILLSISEGLTTQQIANKFGNSFKTIENHRTNISLKLGINGANNLLLFAIENRSIISSINN